MTAERDGGEELAPVIPLFGGSRGTTVPGGGREPGPSHPTRRFPAGAGGRSSGVPADRVDVDGPADGARFTDATDDDATGKGSPESWHTTWQGLGRERDRLRAVPPLEVERRGGLRRVRLADERRGDGRGAPAAPGDREGEELVHRAEQRLLRTLGVRGLSAAEARARLAQELPDEAADEVVDRLREAGVLDDARLAEQLVHTSLVRKKQGRRAIAQALTSRGIPRDVVDAALAELPDDDADRALEYARSKARQLTRYDDDTAVRRLVGQLARRGFGGSLAMSAARRALDEARAPAGRVRFEESPSGA